ncbi:hypothetical protein LP421_01710 (plasmid) [Rhizobium sp. RCAM05350]|nr:hypothetical protein LP421_01710 [Rhizobium sp. RCAM05350]
MISGIGAGGLSLHGNFMETGTMKTLWILTAAFGISASAGSACDFDKVNAQVDVDRSMTTASIPNDEQKAEDIVLLKKTDRVPEDVTVIE